MTNEELAKQIKDGHSELIPALWNQVEKFIKLYVNKYMVEKAGLFQRAGVTFDDLYQEGYFALLDAIKAYDTTTENKLLSYIKYPLLNRFNGVVGLRTAGGRNNLLNTSISLDKPLKSDEEGLVFGDTLESVEANYKMESVIEKEYLKKLHDDLGKCLDMLDPLQKEVIQGKYYSDKTVKEIADTAGLTYSKTRDIEVKALSTMRRKRAYKELLEPYRMDIINSYGYRSSFSAWKNTHTSSTERAVLMLSKLDKLI